jgi:hypothetical protein
LIAQAFKIGDRVKPTSGPYRRTEFVVVGVEGDRISVESEKLRLSFPAKLLKFAPKSKRKSVMDEPKTTHSPHLDASKTPETIEASSPRSTTSASLSTSPLTASPCIDADASAPFGSFRLRSMQVAQGKPLGTRFKVGDRVAGVWDESIIGIVKAIHPSGRVRVKWSETCEIEFFASALILLPPEAKPEGAAGNRVSENAAGDASATLSTSSIRAQIAAIREEGAIAPSHCWIERKVHACGFTEAVFKSRTAIFTGKSGGLCKSKYIGRWESPAHSEAIAAVDRRNRIEKLQKQLEKIKKMFQ